MSVSVKPSWILKPEALMQALHHDMSMPLDIASYTSLEDPLAFTQGVRQFFFWREQLLPSLTPNTVFLAFLGPKGLAQPNVSNVYKGLQVLCDMSQLLEVQTGANSNFLALSFASSSAVECILQQYLFSDDNMVLHIAGNVNFEHRFRLLWLPPLFSINRVHHLLDSFALSHRIRREYISVGNGVSSPTNVVSGFLTLADGKSIDDLPYLIRLPVPHRGCALLSIANRRQICLKCQTLGHVRGQCPMVRCSTCGRVHFPDAPCGKSSYSSVASKNVTSFSGDVWLDSLPEVPVSSDDCSFKPSASASPISSGASLTSVVPQILSAQSVLSIPSVAEVLPSELGSPSASDSPLQPECGHTPSPDTSSSASAFLFDADVFTSSSEVSHYNVSDGAFDSQPSPLVLSSTACQSLASADKPSSKRKLNGGTSIDDSSSDGAHGRLWSRRSHKKGCQVPVDLEGESLPPSSVEMQHDASKCSSSSPGDCEGQVSLHSPTASPYVGVPTSGDSLPPPSIHPDFVLANLPSSPLPDPQFLSGLFPQIFTPSSSASAGVDGGVFLRDVPSTPPPSEATVTAGPSGPPAELTGAGWGDDLFPLSSPPSPSSSSSSQPDYSECIELLLVGFPTDIGSSEISQYLKAHDFQNVRCRHIVDDDQVFTGECYMYYTSMDLAQQDLAMVLSSYNQFPISLILQDDPSSSLMDSAS